MHAWYCKELHVFVKLAEASLMGIYGEKNAGISEKFYGKVLRESFTGKFYGKVLQKVLRESFTGKFYGEMGSKVWIETWKGC